MRRKTIDDYRLEYLKVLFEIRLIFFLRYCNFLLYVFLTIFSFSTQQIEERLVAIKNDNFSP